MVKGSAPLLMNDWRAPSRTCDAASFYAVISSILNEFRFAILLERPVCGECVGAGKLEQHVMHVSSIRVCQAAASGKVKLNFIAGRIIGLGLHMGLVAGRA